MKILVLGDFRRDIPHYMISHARMFSKGFLRCGHDTMEWSYREEILAKSWLNSKKWALKQGKPKADEKLYELVGHYQPDVVFIIEYRLLKEDVVLKLKDMLPKSRFVFWYDDPYFGETDTRVNDVARHCEMFLAVMAGDALAHYKKDNNNSCAAFIPSPCDPDLHYPHEVADKWKSDMLFTGKLQHGSLNKYEQDKDRPALIKYFIDHKNMAMYGDMGYPGVWGKDYLDAIAGTKIGLNINVCNDVCMYHSNRMINYVSNGAFVLSARVPEGELLYEDKKHLVYFDSFDDCIEKADYYLSHDEERKAIATAGVEHAHREYNCSRLCQYILDLLETGSYSASWGKIV